MADQTTPCNPSSLDPTEDPKDDNLKPPATLYLTNSACNKGKQKKRKPEAVKKEKKRQRNFSTEEIELIMSEGGKHSTILKGRLNPSVTNKMKNKIWKSITRQVNSINAQNDREWKDVRKKWQDVTSSARGKARTFVKETKKTGGGPIDCPEMNKAELLALESVAGTSVRGIPGGIDTSTKKSTVDVIRDATNILNDDEESVDSQISFDSPNTIRPPSQRNQIFDDWNAQSDDGDENEISSGQRSPDLFPLQCLAHSSPSSLLSPPPTLSAVSPGPSRLSTQDSASPRSQDPPPRSGRLAPVSLLTPQSASTPAISTQTMPAIKSNRTVNRDIRADEFKALIAENRRTNDLLESLLTLKKAKYAAEGYI